MDEQKSYLNIDIFHDDWYKNFEIAYVDAINRNDKLAVLGMEKIMLEQLGYTQETIEQLRSTVLPTEYPTDTESEPDHQ